jgi:hypothetical protein
MSVPLKPLEKILLPDRHVIHFRHTTVHNNWFFLPWVWIIVLSPSDPVSAVLLLSFFNHFVRCCSDCIIEMSLTKIESDRTIEFSYRSNIRRKIDVNHSILTNGRLFLSNIFRQWRSVIGHHQRPNADVCQFHYWLMNFPRFVICSNSDTPSWKGRCPRLTSSALSTKLIIEKSNSDFVNQMNCLSYPHQITPTKSKVMPLFKQGIPQLTNHGGHSREISESLSDQQYRREDFIWMERHKRLS